MIVWVLHKTILGIKFPIINLRICFQPKDKPMQVLEGPVLVFRNPCLHPGDLRLVEAVNLPELASYRNVVLFPATWSCKSSLADQCSGGDLVKTNCQFPF